MIVDVFNPLTWSRVPPVRRLYLDNDGATAALLDDVDYVWAVQWLWTVTPNSTKCKVYATRNTRVPSSRRQIKVYLHKEVLKRFAPVAPTAQHTICDHKNGESLDCRRDNLRWATPLENRHNRYGDYARQERLFDEVAPHVR